MRRIDHRLFFEGYRQAYGRMTQDVVSGLELLGRNLEDDASQIDISRVAYMLATVKHECAETWQPITERGSMRYFDKYAPDTKLGKRLGNVEPGDGYTYRGRGYVQITGRANYTTWHLEDDPDQALRPEMAYRIMSIGMTRGLFTGKKLSDYINADACDYKGARRIINGTDQAAAIARYAVTLEAILRNAVSAPSH